MIGVTTPRFYLHKGSEGNKSEALRLSRIKSLSQWRVIKSKNSVSRILIGKASSADMPGADPYQVLGVSKKTTSDNIQRAYRSKLHEARVAGDEELISIIEQAHSSIMMQQLSLRMEGRVTRDVAYADKAVFFPWRPRTALADRRLMIISIVVHLALWFYALAGGSLTETQPAIGSAIACACIIYFKLEKIFPSGGGVAFSADESERKQGGKNLLRCALLAIMGTAAGIVLFFTIPDLFSNLVLHRPLPFWVYDYKDFVLNSGVILMNLLLCLFFR